MPDGSWIQQALLTLGSKPCTNAHVSTHTLYDACVVWPDDVVPFFLLWTVGVFFVRSLPFLSFYLSFFHSICIYIYICVYSMSSATFARMNSFNQLQHLTTAKTRQENMLQSGRSKSPHWASETKTASPGVVATRNT